jgi:hypothetical protein
MVVESSAPPVYATWPEQQSPRIGACAAVSYSYLIEDLFVCLFLGSLQKRSGACVRKERLFSFLFGLLARISE